MQGPEHVTPLLGACMHSLHHSPTAGDRPPTTANARALCRPGHPLGPAGGGPQSCPGAWASPTRAGRACSLAARAPAAPPETKPASRPGSSAAGPRAPRAARCGVQYRRPSVRRAPAPGAPAAPRAPRRSLCGQAVRRALQNPGCAFQARWQRYAARHCGPALRDLQGSGNQRGAGRPQEARPHSTGPEVQATCMLGSSRDPAQLLLRPALRTYEV